MVTLETNVGHNREKKRYGDEMFTLETKVVMLDKRFFGERRGGEEKGRAANGESARGYSLVRPYNLVGPYRLLIGALAYRPV